MTEAEWLACEDAEQPLGFLAGKVSDRKLRLLGVACCRRIWPHLAEKRSRWLVTVSELYADGMVTYDRLQRAWEGADLAEQRIHLGGGGDVEQNPAQAVTGLGPQMDLSFAVEMAAATFGAIARGEAYDRIWRSPRNELDARKRNDAQWADDDAIRIVATEAEAHFQADLLRDIFGNPFRPVAFEAAWRTEAAVGLALRMYDERDFRAMPILADALEEAGCEHDDILRHCREPGTHVRGCWVVDLVLGKE